MILLVRVPHQDGIELLVGADVAGVLAAGGAVAHGGGFALPVLGGGAVVRSCALPKKLVYECLMSLQRWASSFACCPAWSTGFLRSNGAGVVPQGVIGRAG